MKTQPMNGCLAGFVLAAILAGAVGIPRAAASPAPQSTSSAGAKKAAAKSESQPATASDVQVDPEVMESTRRTFMEVLERYPRLINVISRDPSLLDNQEYITANAPGLWEFLQKHPDVSRDPEFFLAGRLHRAGFVENEPADPMSMRILNDVWPFLIFVIMVGAVLWILRVILENRRWSRLAKVQAEVHSKLLDRFASSQELLAYIATEPGKRFLESAPIPVDLDQQGRLSAPVGRILWSLQVGLILAMGGLGMLYIRSSVPDASQPLLVLGTLGLTFGAGFVLSALFSYGISKHLGLFERSETSTSPRTELGTLGNRNS